IPLLLLGVLSARQLQRLLTAEVQSTLRAETENFSDIVQDMLAEREADVRSWSEDAIVRGALLYATYKKSDSVLSVLQRRYPVFKVIVLFTPDGKAVSASDAALLTRYAARPELIARSTWFQQALEERLTDEAALGQDEVLGQRVLRFAIPVTSPVDGHPMGLLVAAYDWNLLEAEVKPAIDRATARGQSSLRLAIADARGQLLFGPRSLASAVAPLAEAALENDSGVVEFSGKVGGFQRAASESFQGSDWLYIAVLDRDEAYALVRQSVLAAVLMLVIFGGVALVGSFLMARRMVQPIQALNEAVGRIVRDGDLTQEIHVHSTDEIGQLATSFGAMVRKLREVPLSLQESAQVLTAAVKNLTTSTQEQSQAITQQASALQETQVTAQEIKETSVVAAQKAESVLAVVDRADDLSKAGSVAIEDSLSNLADIRERVGEIAGKINELSARTLQIGSITQTVTKLADQSNMLALNAAIEAVRSGEHGKGFSVVAKEIRTLADQSLKATERVNKILEDVSMAIRETVQITEKGAQRMEAGLVQVKTSGENLRELSTIVRENASAVRQISAAVSQQNAGVSQVFAAVSDLNRMMEESVARLDSTHQATAELQAVTERVVGIVKSYRV
ncbi:methyl-accepting chemotaxis protein, partial [Hyalangium versicolor]|uniref:methyl-accepting chemotaxis protein n=1 Tax=Hyalangium versicolor TaxID=2861190 RepID=UPI001CCEBC37